MMAEGVAYACGGDERPGPREECPNELHDWPLPVGYTDAHEVAKSRLYRRWANVRCPDCGKYGWRPGRLKDGETPSRIGLPGKTEERSSK